VEPARGLAAPGTATLTLEGVARANASTVPPVILGALVNIGAGDAIVPVYGFTGDTRGRSNCTGECVVIWPPLLTQMRPQGTNGVDGRAMGTIRRPDGSRQVTYMGQPLYLFGMEAPGSSTGTPGAVNGQGLGAKFCPAGMTSCTGFFVVPPQ
jgi:predicted lipoprotein with Yx(FWY)xxD motif